MKIMKILKKIREIIYYEVDKMLRKIIKDELGIEVVGGGWYADPTKKGIGFTYIDDFGRIWMNVFFPFKLLSNESRKQIMEAILKFMNT